MRLIIKENYDNCALWSADYIAKRIIEHNPTSNNPFVLGLPTGSTPIGIYKRLIELYQKKFISFKNIITFNMDEYVGLDEANSQSYHYFMKHNFFDYIDIPPENINILNGCAPDLQKECLDYEQKILDAGGIDLFLGGTGCDGHIAFNEPGSSLSSQTRIKTLTDDTRKVNSRFFDGDIKKVPETALTVGIGTITNAKEVLLMMTGPDKAQALYHAVEGSISGMWPVSILQLHKNAIIVTDDNCTSELKVGTVRYFNNIESKIKDFEGLFEDK